MAINHIKPVKLVTGHISPKERQRRIEAEEKSKTGEPMQVPPELRGNKFAIKEFKRIKGLYSKIEHDDEMYSNLIGRYCVMRAEEQELLNMKSDVEKRMAQLEKEYKEQTIDNVQYYEMSSNTQKSYLKIVDLLSRHRKMLHDLEKSSLLSLADNIRAIPKKPQEEEQTEMEKYLAKRKG